MLGKSVAGDATTQTFDLLNRMASWTDGTNAATYTYNPDNMRRSKTVDGTTTEHVWVGTEIALDISGGHVVSYVAGVKSDHGWHVYNANGDVEQLADDSGNVVRRYDYDPFGVQLQGLDDLDRNPYRYNLQYYDTESGYIYLRMRYYDPSIGRFISADQYWNTWNMQSSIVAILQSTNLYAYALSNPLRFADPSGFYVIEHAVEDPGISQLNRNVILVYDDPNRGFIRQADWFQRNVYPGVRNEVIYIRTEGDFRQEWRKLLLGGVNDVHLFFHGGVGEFYFQMVTVATEDIRKLRQVTISGSVGLWSCNGGTVGEHSAAAAISERVYGRPVVALDGGAVTYRHWYQWCIGAPLTKNRASSWAVFTIDQNGSGSLTKENRDTRRAPISMFLTPSQLPDWLS